LAVFAVKVGNSAVMNASSVLRNCLAVGSGHCMRHNLGVIKVWCGSHGMLHKIIIFLWVKALRRIRVNLFAQAFSLQMNDPKKWIAEVTVLSHVRVTHQWSASV